MKKILSAVLSIAIMVALIPLSSMQVHAADQKVEWAIEWAIETANDDSHGYSMSSRNGPNYDCSSFVSYAFKSAGFAIKGVPNSSSMISTFSKVGFKAYKKGETTPRRGDIYVQPGSHVELYLGDGYCAGAHENTDGKSGDSKGDEIDVRPLSKCSWCRNKKYTYILRYEGPETYTYTFTYNALNGSTPEGNFTAHFGKEFTIHNSAIKMGYTLAGWNIQRGRDNKWLTVDGWLTEEEILKKNISKNAYLNGTTLTFGEDWTSSFGADTLFTLYAVWVPDKYSVKFDANGGLNAPESALKVHGNDLILSEVSPTRSGYTFLGWAESPSATVPTYLPGASYYSNEETTLYAVWQQNVIDSVIFHKDLVNTTTLAAFKLVLSGSASASDEGASIDYNQDGIISTLDLATLKLHLAGIEKLG